MNYKTLTFAALLLLTPMAAFSACDCGSTDAANPCTGQAIAVTVVAGTPNGGTAVNQVYNWSFNSGGGDARCGQFANGDYWVAPAVGQSTVTIAGISSTSHAGFVHADADPTTENMGLLNAYTNYNATEDIIAALPLSYSGINSIVASIQRNEAIEGACEHTAVGHCIDSVHVVTVMPSVPALAGAQSLRPNITGESKEIISLSDLDLNRLVPRTFLSGTTAAGIEEIRARWSHSTEVISIHSSSGPSLGFYGEAGLAFRSHSLVDDYGAGWSRVLTSDIVTLLSADNSMAEKEPALAAILSYGLDIYHALYDAPPGITRNWASGAGQHSGKFFAPALLGALLVDQTKAGVLKEDVTHAHDYYYSGPQEITQHTVGPNGPVYGDYGDTEGGYWNEMLKSQCFTGGVNEFGTCPYITGQRIGHDPYLYIDGVGMLAGGGYTSIGLASQRNLVGLMYLIPAMYSLVNTPSLPAFVNRYLTHGVSAANDPCASPDTRENATSCDAYRDKDCIYYKVTWGPDPGNPGECIKTATPPYTQIGRFTARDGVAVAPAPSYSASQIVNNWSVIMGLPVGQRHLFRNVRIGEVEP